MSEPNAESNSDSKSHIDEKEPTDVGNDDSECPASTAESPRPTGDDLRSLIRPFPVLPVAQLLTLDEAKAIISESIAGKELDPNFSSVRFWSGSWAGGESLGLTTIPLDNRNC